MSEKPKIVCLGGGHGMPKGVLSGLKKRKVRVSAVCAMLDSGGSSGRLREEYGVQAPGDLRRALIALANTSPALEELFDFRFQVGELEGHNFANLLITALELSTGGYEETVEELKKLLRVKHGVFPVTLDSSDVCVRLENGRVVRGETDIDRPKHDPGLEIEEVFLEPEAEAYPPALEAVEKGDLVVIGPGDLYSSLAQVLLVKGVSEAVAESEAGVVYLTNLLNKKGETDGFEVSDFALRVENWLGVSLDTVFYNPVSYGEERLQAFRRRHSELRKPVRAGRDLDSRFVKKDLAETEGPIEHDSDRVAEALLGLIK